LLLKGTMKASLLNRILLPLAVFALAVSSFATTVPQGTGVTLAFKDSLSSKTAKAGDKVRMEVVDDVRVDGKTVLRAGTPVTAVIEKVDKNGRFGKNARIRIVINPVRGIPLQPREKGKAFQGGKTDKAAIASGAGALVLGPVGLIGGVFIKGRNVNIKPGDKVETEVSRTVRV